jgi:hypothetical protein
VRARLDDGKQVRQPARLTQLPRESLRVVRAPVGARLLRVSLSTILRGPTGVHFELDSTFRLAPPHPAKKIKTHQRASLSQREHHCGFAHKLRRSNAAMMARRTAGPSILAHSRRTAGGHPSVRNRSTADNGPVDPGVRQVSVCRVGPGSFTPSPSQIPDLTLSRHPARVIAQRLPPSAEISGSSRFNPVGPSSTAMTCPLRSTGITPLHHYYEAVRPSQRSGTFGLAVGAACAFSLGIAGQVLTFCSRAW